MPAAYDEVITVSALADFNGQPGGGAASTCRSDVDDTFADFSNHGADVALIAPGVCILSTWKCGGYDTISGSQWNTATDPDSTHEPLLNVANFEVHPRATSSKTTGTGRRARPPT